MSLTAIPNVTSGGVAIPLGRNMFFMRGKKHKDGGIVIGDKRKGIEVEDGEVVKLDQHNTKVFSSMPLLAGNSPASLILNGANPQRVFRAQEQFKDRVGLKDDGTNKYKDGGEEEGYGWADATKDAAGFVPVLGTLVDAYDFYKNPSWENAGWLLASAASDLVGTRAAVRGLRMAAKGAKMVGRGVKAGAVALRSVPRLAVGAVQATRPSRSLRVAARAAMERNIPALAFETSFNNNLVRNTLVRGLAPQVANSRGLVRTGVNVVGNGLLQAVSPIDAAFQTGQTLRDMWTANQQKNQTNNKEPKKYAAGGKGHISNRGVNLIGTFEGFMPRIYKDSGGVETIGYGETDRDFINRYRGRQISRAEATQQLRNRAQWFYDQVANKTVGWDKLNQDQRDVLTSYAYNIGVGGYQRHKKLLAAIAAGDYNLAAKNINAGMNDARNPGLRKRRLKEQFIFTNGYGGDLFNSYNKIHTNGDTKGFVKPVVVAPTATNLNEGFMTNVVPKPDPMLKDFEDLERLRYMGSRLPQFKAGGKVADRTNLFKKNPYAESRIDNTAVARQQVVRNNGRFNVVDATRRSYHGNVNGAAARDLQRTIRKKVLTFGYNILPGKRRTDYDRPLSYVDKNSNEVEVYENLVYRTPNNKYHGGGKHTTYKKTYVPYDGNIKNKGDDIIYKNGKAYTSRYVRQTSFVNRFLDFDDTKSFRTKKELHDYVNANYKTAKDNGIIKTKIDKNGRKYDYMMNIDEAPMLSEFAPASSASSLVARGAAATAENAAARGSAAAATAAEGSAASVTRGARTSSSWFSRTTSRVKNFAKNAGKNLGKLYDNYIGNKVETKAVKRATDYFVNGAKRANKKGITQFTKPTREVVESYIQKYNKKFGTNVSAENVFNRIKKPVGQAYDYIANPTVKGWAKNVWRNHKGKIFIGGAALAYLRYNVLANNSNPDTSSHDAPLVKPSVVNNGPAVINTPPNQEVAPSDSTQTPNVTIQAPEDTPQNNNVPNVTIEDPNKQNNTGGNTATNSNSSETVTPTNTNTKPVNNTQHSNNTDSTNNVASTNNTNAKPTTQQPVNTPSVNNVSPNTNTASTPTNNPNPNNTSAAVQHEVNDSKPIYEVKSNKPQLNTDTSGDKANPKFIDKLFPNVDNKQNANDANSNTHMPTTQGTNKGIAVGLDGKVRLINTSSDSPYVPINTTTTPIAQRRGKYVNGNPVFNEDKSGNYTFYKDKKGNLIPSKKFKFVDSEYVLNPNYYSQENRNELGAASIANDINMQEQMKNAKYRDLDGKVIDANYKPTPVPLNPSNKSLWQKFKELDDGTKSDIVGIGSNVISGVSGYLNNLHMLNSLKAPVAPVLNQAAKLKTTVNINPQLDTIDRGVQSAVRDSNENTASSNVAASRNMAASLYGVASKNQLYGNKENAETELINKDKLNQQEVARANVEAYNKHTNDVINFRNTVADKRAENFNGLLNTLNSAVQDAITKREQRTNFRNSVKASLVSNPDSALLMANAFPKLLPTDFMNELQKRQREIEENRKKALAAQVEMFKAQQGAYERFRPVTQ
nr:MAG TPA: Lysozyme [Crassvirales sp.]